jgi:hypothetical protein
MSNARMIPVALMLLVPGAALAHDLDGPPLHVDPGVKDCSVEFAPNLTQGAFARFVREFGSVSAFKMMAPPTTLGRRQFLLGVEYLSFTVEEHSEAWNDTFAHPNADHPLGSDKAFPMVRLRAGVTDRLDLGAFYTRNPDANYGWLGVEARYGVMRQDPKTPVNLVVRGAYTKTLYVHDMDMHALTADVAVGRTFWSRFTPYVDVGGDVVLARERSDVVNLHNEVQPVAHVIGGFELRYAFLSLGAEAHIAALTSYQLQIATVF